MRKLVLLIALVSYSFIVRASGPSDLVIISNPYTSPGNETNDEDLSIVFYDANGKQITLEYTYDSVTNKITIKGGTGIVFIVVTNKKTKESKSSKVYFTAGG